MSNPPVVSVTMPVYNAERYLPQAIESILVQTFTDFEFLILNDGSTDRSLKILQKYAKQDDRIRITSRDNRGISKTRNELLAQAQGEFIAVMDADDIALPERFTLQVTFLRKHPEVLCVGGAHEFIDEAGRVLFRHEEPTDDYELQQLALKGHTPINHPSAMMRRQAVLQVGGYDDTLPPAEDIDLYLKLGEIGKLANLKETVLKYRQHSKSASERQQVRQNRLRQLACERAWQRRGIEGGNVEIKVWRPTDRQSRHEFILKYGWQFFNTGQIAAAIAYGIKAIRTRPLAISSWRLLFTALFKTVTQR